MENLTGTTDIMRAIKRTIATNERYHGAYFWNPDTSARGRRCKERNFKSDNPDYYFSFGDYEWQVEHNYNESCSHCYYQLRIFKDDHNTNITALKNVLKKLEEKEKKDWEEIYKNMEKYNPALKQQPKPKVEKIDWSKLKLPELPTIRPREKQKLQQLVLPPLPENYNYAK